MLLGIIVAMLIAGLLGYPILLILIVGAFSTALLAFAVAPCQRERMKHLMLVLGMIVTSHFMLRLAVTRVADIGDTAKWFMDIVTSDALLGASCIITISLACFWGIFGPVQHLPFDMEGVLHMIRKTDKSKDKK